MKFPKEVEDLIESAIADGVLSADERAALLKRCLLSGVDPKVLEPELDRRLAERKKGVPPVPPTPLTETATAKPTGKATVHALDDLIKEYLTDGIISEKERAVLLKKAEDLGIDRDEMDLYIDAQQQKTDQAVDAAANKRRGKTCPYCGGSIPALTDKCPHCGASITPEASDELQEIFDKLEDALVNFKSGEDIEKNKAEVERYVRKAKMYYGNNPKVQKLLEEVESESVAAEENAKKNARNKFLLKNKKVIAIALGVLLVLIGVGIYFATRTTEADIIEKVTELVKKGDIDGAQKVYDKWGGNSTPACEIIENAKIEKFMEDNDYDQAVGLFLQDHGGDLDHVFLWNDESSYINLLTSCVKDMVKKGKTDDAKKFIDRQYNSIATEMNDETAKSIKQNLMSLLN